MHPSNREEYETLAEIYADSGVPLEIVIEDLVDAGRTAISRLAKFSVHIPQSCHVYGDFPTNDREVSRAEIRRDRETFARGIVETNQGKLKEVIADLIEAGRECMSELNRLHVPYPSQCIIFDSPISYLGQ